MTNDGVDPVRQVIDPRIRRLASTYAAATATGSRTSERTGDESRTGTRTGTRAEASMLFSTAGWQWLIVANRTAASSTRTVGPARAKMGAMMAHDAHSAIGARVARMMTARMTSNWVIPEAAWHAKCRSGGRKATVLVGRRKTHGCHANLGRGRGASDAPHLSALKVVARSTSHASTGALGSLVPRRFPLDVVEQVDFAPSKTWMLEFPDLNLIVGCALIGVVHLVEAIHVELTNEGLPVGMLEPVGQYDA